MALTDKGRDVKRTRDKGCCNYLEETITAFIGSKNTMK